MHTAVNLFEQSLRDAFDSFIGRGEFAPPAISELNAIAGEDVVRALIDLRELININDDIAFTHNTYQKVIDVVLTHIDQHESIDAKSLSNPLWSI